MLFFIIDLESISPLMCVFLNSPDTQKDQVSCIIGLGISRSRTVVVSILT